MEENSKINELCEVFSTGIRMPSKYYALGDRIEKTKTEIIKGLYSKNKKKLKKKLETICDDYEEMNCMEDDTYFNYGFSLAVQILAEAFTCK